jgi:hypothetical protein
MRKEGAKQKPTDPDEPPPILASEGFICRLANGIEEVRVLVVEVGVLGPCDIYFGVIEASNTVWDWASSGFCIRCSESGLAPHTGKKA